MQNIFLASMDQRCSSLHERRAEMRQSYVKYDVLSLSSFIEHCDTVIVAV